MKRKNIKSITKEEIGKGEKGVKLSMKVQA